MIALLLRQAVQHSLHIMRTLPAPMGWRDRALVWVFCRVGMDGLDRVDGLISGWECRRAACGKPDIVPLVSTLGNACARLSGALHEHVWQEVSDEMCERLPALLIAHLARRDSGARHG